MFEWIVLASVAILAILFLRGAQPRDDDGGYRR